MIRSSALPSPPPVHPDKTLEVTVTYLNLNTLAEPAPTIPSQISNLSLLRAKNPTVSFYRYLYYQVGEPWLWYERRGMSDTDLHTIITNDAVAIHVLYIEGTPAGYVELDNRVSDEVEIAYFGLLPEYIGCKLGPWFLYWAVREAQSQSPDRIWVNTCTLDHPAALALYQRTGFVIYERQTLTIWDPRTQPYW
tara:strand:+ start:803 stop:1381 length:579 start_codon:yes stop_codon:yes gene_type:complete